MLGRPQEGNGKERRQRCSGYTLSFRLWQRDKGRLAGTHFYQRLEPAPALSLRQMERCCRFFSSLRGHGLKLCSRHRTHIKRS